MDGTQSQRPGFLSKPAGQGRVNVDQAMGGICARCAHPIVKGTLIHCSSSFTPQAGWGPGRPPTLKPANVVWAPVPPPFSSLQEDSGASTICWKGPSTILLPLQEALNNYINLPKYGKKSLQIRDTWQVFRLHIFCLARHTVLLGSYCYLRVFPLIVGHMASLVLFNFLKAGSTFWLQTYYREKCPQKVWIVLECPLRENA